MGLSFLFPRLRFDEIPTSWYVSSQKVEESDMVGMTSGTKAKRKAGAKTGAKTGVKSRARVKNAPVQDVAVKADARTKLLEAALSVIRTKGYSATTVDDSIGSASCRERVCNNV